MKNNWEIKKLGDICDIRTGKKDVNQGNPNGKYPFFTCAREHTYSDEYSFDTEALLIAGNGDVGHVSYYNGKFEAYQRTYVLSNFKGVSAHYMFLFLNGFLKDTVSKQKLGNTMPYIKMGMLTEFSVPIPPLAEQKQIVKKLDEVFSGLAEVREKAERNLKNAKELFESYLQNAVFEQNYEVKALSEVCTGVEYGSSTKSESTGKVAVLRMGNVQNGRFNWDKLVYSNNTEENTKYLLKYNDVLFNRTNSPELVGKTAIYKNEMSAIFAGYLIRIHRKEELLDADYLNYYLNSEQAITYGRSVTISSVNQANINGTKLKSYPIPVPTLVEQENIVKKLDALSELTKELEKIFRSKIKVIDELKKSVLQKAFTGEM